MANVQVEFHFFSLNNPKFSDTEKLRLLIDAVKDGRAKEILTDLEITQGNWGVAWGRFDLRFNSNREVVFSALKPLMEFVPLKNASGRDLFRLTCLVRTARSQIDQVPLATGVTKEDVLYLHLLTCRLDPRTLLKFTQSLKTSEVPSVTACIEFVEKFARDLDLTSETSSLAVGFEAQKGMGGKDKKQKVLSMSGEKEDKEGREKGKKKDKKNKKKGNNNDEVQPIILKTKTLLTKERKRIKRIKITKKTRPIRLTRIKM